MVWWGGRGQQFLLESSKQRGSLFRSYHSRSKAHAADAKFSVGGLNRGRQTVGGRSGAIFIRPGFESPTKKTAQMHYNPATA